MRSYQHIIVVSPYGLGHAERTQQGTRQSDSLTATRIAPHHSSPSAATRAHAPYRCSMQHAALGSATPVESLVPHKAHLWRCPAGLVGAE